MNIQPVGQTGAWILQNRDLAPGPPGTVGNLRFTPQQDGTTPVSHASMFPHGSSIEDLRFDVSDASGDVRSQPPQCIGISEAIRRVGNLLSGLTAHVDDAHALSRIADELVQISELSQGSLSNLFGGMESLSTYLGAMTYPELIALNDRIFNRPEARDAALKKISSDEFRIHAAAVLDQVGRAIHVQLAQNIVSEPFGEIVNGLTGRSVNAVKVAEHLIKLHTDLAMVDFIRVVDQWPIPSMLDIYFQSLSDNGLEAALIAFKVQKQREAYSALFYLNDGFKEPRITSMLDRLVDSLGRAMYARAQPRLQQLQGRMAQLKADPDQGGAVSVMKALSTFVNDHRVYGWMPINMGKKVEQLTLDGAQVVEKALLRLSPSP